MKRRPWIQSSWTAARLLAIAAFLGILTGCSTIRVTDPPRTATEQFLESQACAQAISQLSATALRDRKIYVDSTYLTAYPAASTQPSAESRLILAEQKPSPEQLFVLGELRSMLLNSGVRLTDRRDQADIVLEVRSGGIGIDRADTLLGVPSVLLSPGGSGVNNDVPVITPELALYKHIQQHGYAAVAFVAYWKTSGEIVASSGPYIGRTVREDYFILGTALRAVGNIPTVEGPKAGK